LLGLPASYDLDQAALAVRHRELSRALHPDRYAGRGASERRQALNKAIEVNDAFRALKDPVKRAELLLGRLGVAVGEQAEREVGPEFLMEIMELREALGDLRRARNVDGVEALSLRVEAEQRAVRAQLEEGFRRALSDAVPDPEGLRRELLPLLARLRYYGRFFAEVHAILDDLG
jgi:molecular chaperone HscB